MVYELVIETHETSSNLFFAPYERTRGFCGKYFTSDIRSGVVVNICLDFYIQ